MHTTMKRALTSVAGAALVVSFATACGGGGGSRPSVDEISSGIKKNMGDSFGGKMSDKLADCLAKEFHDSDLSNGALNAIADGDKDYKASKKDKDALQDVSTSAGKNCVSAAG